VAEEGTVRLAVEDSGPGIPAEERERVFDRFYRVPGSDAAGSGLGLAIIKSIAERHGATLALGESKRLGGLEVTVSFPT
jgi:two-component system OmpR family sensor kinase